MQSPSRLALFLGGLALLVAASVLLLSREEPSPAQMVEPAPSLPQAPASAARPSMLAETRASTAASRPARTPVLVSVTEESVDPVAEEQKFALLDALHEAASTYSPEGIPLIEPSLYSSDRQIREAAADAMVVLGETEGAKVLRKAAAKARDPREAVALIERAEYLELPPGRLLLREKNPNPTRAPARPSPSKQSR